jgi:polyhydroxybutyrate depolymerase
MPQVCGSRPARRPDQFRCSTSTARPTNIIGQNETGAPATIQRWIQIDGCTPDAQITYQKGSATCRTYRDPSGRSSVTLCTIEGMGHQWPGSTVTLTPERARQLGLPEWFGRLGPGTDDLDATAMLLTFFGANPMRR